MRKTVTAHLSRVSVLYGTTPTFLERLGLDSVNDLPPLGEFFPTTDVVEALERGLRVVPDDEVLAEAGHDAEPSEGDPSDPPDPASPADHEAGQP